MSNTENNKDMIDTWLLINLLHVFILAPLAIYIGVMKNNSRMELVFLMITIIIFGIWYHIDKLSKINKIDVISITHILLGTLAIGYLIIPKRSQWFYYSMILVGIYSAIKHSYYLSK